MRIACFVCFFFSVLVLQSQDHRAGCVIFKLKPEFKEICTASGIQDERFTNVLNALEMNDLFRKFPSSQNQSNRSKLTPKGSIDLTLIYELHYSKSLPVPKAVDLLTKSGLVEYAEPAYISKLLFVPNDSLLARQWHLVNISAFDGWDIDTSSADIVVGITDTGIDWDHPDLVNSIKYNTSDPIDGVDNDQNGFIDDFRGWNFFDANNDPNETSFSHGTHVSGLVAATPNNGQGIAGVCYGCKVLPVKCGSGLELAYGYEGVVYAVRNGAQIVNCSWGSTSYTQFGHDIVKWATDTGALIVCGAGNNNNEAEFFPASFPEAFSIAGTDSINQKFTASTYNYNVDLCAPGQKVFSTKNGTYNYESGTSMSSPIVAGAAALVKHRFPQLTPLQVKAQLCEKSTNIYAYHDNEELYSNRLGRGMLNIKRALDSLAEISIDVANVVLSDGGDELFLNGEEFSLGIQLLNVMNPVNSVTLELSSLSESLTVIEGSHVFQSMGTMQYADNYAAPFTVRVNESNIRNERVFMQLTVTSGTYLRVQIISAVINPDFVNVNVNDIRSTVSSNGLIGYSSFQRLYGLGFEVGNYGNVLYEAGLLIGHKSSKSTRVVDRIRGTNGADRDFWPQSYIVPFAPVTDEAFRAAGSFTDSSAIADEIGLSINQEVIAYDELGHRNYFIIEYTIRNESDDDLRDVYAGIYADWDIDNPNQNKGQSIVAKRLGFVSNTLEPDVAAGIQGLTEHVPFHSYMIDNANNGSGGIDISTDGFSSDEKYIALSNNRLKEGMSELGTDVSHVLSFGPLNIPIGDSVKLAFALHGAGNPDSLIRSADSAFVKYNGYLPGQLLTDPVWVSSIYPNPATNYVSILFELKSAGELSFLLFNAQGGLVGKLSSESFYAGANLTTVTLPFLTSGIYFLKMQGKDFSRTVPISYLRP